MRGKTVVMTGATSGLGESAALSLAEKGARIVFTARSHSKADALLGKLKDINSKVEHAVYLCDFASLSEVKRAGEAIAVSEPRIDVLANNAGALFLKRGETADRLESSFGVNHMAPFVLTRTLLERIRATPGARIVFTASAAHSAGGPLQFDDLQATRKFKPFAAYGRSKLANIYVTQELARRLQGTGVTVNCFHPGFVASNLGTNNGWLATVGMRVASMLAQTPAQGADTLVWLAASPEAEGKNGGYFDKRRLGKLAPFAGDPQAAARLWEISEQFAQQFSP
jgi:NAD(P)-dependent dehydrogenase (short-subunit alcohol dehydrogenase family)